MHNIKDIRQNPDLFKKQLSDRFADIDIDKIILLDEKNRKLIQEKETLEKEKSNNTVKGDLIKSAFITSTMGVSYKVKLGKSF